MMNQPLRREDWDFSTLPKTELRAALSWEMLREWPAMVEVVEAGRAWLEGKRSRRRSEVERASIRVGAVFQEFIPWHEASVRHQATVEDRRRDYDRWLAKYLRPLLKNHGRPWLCLPQAERDRLCSIVESAREAQVVSIPEWWEVLGYFQDGEVNADEPLLFHHRVADGASTHVLLRIEWRHTRKRILAAIGRILDQHEPAGLKRWSARGRKDRDRLVALERLGMMRLLHQHTLAEMPRVAPEAWKRYGARKWYEERRQALKDFRAWSHSGEAEKMWPRSWETKAVRTRRG